MPRVWRNLPSLYGFCGRACRPLPLGVRAQYNAGMNDSAAAADNWGIIGHEWAVSLLSRSLAHGRNRHGYLITGSPALGKMRLALAFAMALNCEAAPLAQRPCFSCRTCADISRDNHPDLIVAGADAPMKIDEARDVLRVLALKPYSARYRIAILDDVQLMAPLAQDALLKTLEEPAPHAVLILLATSAERVLPTIRSRAQHIPLRPIRQGLIKNQLLAIGAEEARADLIARLSGGRVGWALAAAADAALLETRQEALDTLSAVIEGTRLPRMKESETLSRRAAKDKAQLRAVLEIWQSYWRDVLLHCCGSPVKPCNVDRHAEIRALAGRISAGSARAALAATAEALRALDTNANPRLLLDALFLTYPGLGT